MITFEINKWVLVAIICGIMLLGALIELLIACIYSNRDNAKKARTNESADKITQLENEIKLQNADIGLMRQSVEFLLTEYGKQEETKKDLEQDGLQEKYNSLEKKYEDVFKKQVVNERRIDQTTRAFNRFKVDTYEREKDLTDDFHDLEEHVHTWLNGRPVIKVKDKDMEVESYTRDYYVPTRTEAVLKVKDKDPEAISYSRDCYVPTSKEAMRIIENLYDKLNEQGYITIADYLSEFGKDHTVIQKHYGWSLNEFDLSAVYAQSLNGVYKVHMPEPILLCYDKRRMI